MASYPTYIKKYLRFTPAVKQIFDDLDEYRDFVRMQLPQVRFNESDLYNNRSYVWQKFAKKSKKTYSNGRR